MVKATIRQRKLKNGGISLYLDYYPPIKNLTNGTPTRREALRLFLYDKPRTLTEKNHNRGTMEIAQSIKAQREYMYNKPEIYTPIEKKALEQLKRSKACFLEYIETNLPSAKNYKTIIKYLQHFAGTDYISFKKVDVQFLNRFKEHLQTTRSARSQKYGLTKNTVHMYIVTLKIALNKAYKDGFFDFDISSHLKNVKAVETKKTHLSIEELRQLKNTPCTKNPQLKNAALFSALTGLRFSDIVALQWENVYVQKDFIHIEFTQQKTKTITSLPISNEAFQFLGERKNHGFIFAELKYSHHTNRQLNEWMERAAVAEKKTFHSFRHTFATLQLAHGTDIYTVSKMLGHKDLKSTQIYAHVLDSTKRNATGSITLF